MLKPQNSFITRLFCGFFAFKYKKYIQLPRHSQTGTATYQFRQTDMGRQKIQESEGPIMRKQVKQNHPCCEGHGLWAKFQDFPQRKVCGKAFRTGAEIPPSSDAGQSLANRVAYRFGQPNTSACFCGRAIPAVAVRSGDVSHGCVIINAGFMLNTKTEYSPNTNNRDYSLSDEMLQRFQSVF